MDDTMYCPLHGQKEGMTVCDQCGAALVSANLSDEEMKICGSGTPNACFALTLGPNGCQCSMLCNRGVAQMAGMQLGWRVNVDPADKKAWCPKGVLKNSKKQ